MDNSDMQTGSNPKTSRILIVDDEEIVHQTLNRILGTEGYTIDSAYGGKETLERINDEYDLIICDIRMPDLDGIEVLRQIKKRDLPVEVLMLTGYASLDSAAQAMNYGARGYLMKPIENIPEFRVKVREAIHISRIAHENKQIYEALMAGQIDSIIVDGKPWILPDIHEQTNEIIPRLMYIIHDGIVVLDYDGNIIFANIYFSQMLGESYRYLLSKSFESFIPQEEREYVIGAFTRLACGEAAKNIQTHLITSFGRLLAITINCSPIYHEMNYRGIALVITDITEITRVREKVELLANLVENARYDMMVIVKPDGQIMECNALFRNTFGYTQSEILSRNIRILLKFQANLTWEVIMDHIEQHSDWQGELSAITKSCGKFPFEMTISRSVDKIKDGFYIVFMRDITERKHAEESLRESEERNRLLIDFSPYGIVNHIEGKITFVNPQAAKILGAKSPQELIGKSVLDIVHTDYHDLVRERIMMEGEGKIAPLIEEKFLRMDGSTVDVEIVSIPVNIRGKIYIYSVFSDITERKNAIKLRIEKEALEYATKAKSEFLASMSHELRTPLNSILGFSQLLGDDFAGELTEKQKKYINNINNGGTFLLNLINDILDLSKVEAGKITLNKEKISLKATVEETTTLIKEKAMKHNININKEFDPVLDFIDADKQRVKQILFNLLSNAIKFSKEEGGNIMITANKIDENVQISVSDTGIGIKPENIGKMFQKFEQLDKKISAKYGGTGLGLAITKQLVELHGGNIRVESKFGEGTTFTFTLPLEAKMVLKI